MIDRELKTCDVQGLGDADHIAGFFAALGYNTDVRISQSPATIGITADSLARQIHRIELIASHEQLLHVYLFELSSVTIAATRDLARAFRNRSGNYLLILTSDYERIDFVLVEKTAPTLPLPDKSMGVKQVIVRPRVLTVERQKPTRVDLRVLRRFTYTESDPIAQYEKLLSAFGSAYWSEDFFDNRALFADYYLLERLRETDAWKNERPEAAYRSLRQLYSNAATRFKRRSEAELRRELFAPAFEALGFDPKEGKSATDSGFEADYNLCAPHNGKKPVALCLTYPWGRSLDGKDYTHDSDTPDENPGMTVVSLLTRGETDWVIVTNGKHWRLYSAKTHSRATNYYEIDLEETLAQDDPSESFRYFWLLFRREAFEVTEVPKEETACPVCFLDTVLQGSEDYAKRLGERLKEKVFEKVFPHLAEGFITYIHQQKGADIDLPQEFLDKVFHGTLTFLYRLLFLLYAEARDLLPVREARGYSEQSLSKLKREVAERAGRIRDQVSENLKEAYRTDSTELYSRLSDLFRIVAKGDALINMPAYNGGLFLTEPEPDDETPEAVNARFLLEHKVPDRFLAEGLDLLAREEDEKTFELVFIDYKSLDVRHLGSIYEGLLEFKLRIAPEKMGICSGKKTEEVIPYREAKKQNLKILTEGRGKNAKERTYPKGKLYLENDKRERKATGSYYTPDYIVKYIVEHTVGPVLGERFEAIRPKLREAEKAYHTAVKAWDSFKRAPGKHPDLVAQRYQSVVDDLFDIKVLDPAMGSGHFLVEAVDLITDRMLDFLNAFPWNPVLVQLRRTRETILAEMDRQEITIDESRLTDVNLLKRHVLKRCIYGVDLNPMAVELAKVSLWLDCFTLGAPLSFLDHHLKCGNSLIGSDADTVQKALEVKGQLTLFETSEFSRMLLAVDLMRKIGELSDVTPEMVQESRRQFRSAVDALAPAKRVMDVYTSRWFGNEPVTIKHGKQKESKDIAVDFLRSDESVDWLKGKVPLERLKEHDRQIAETATVAAREKQFFHWELEFPEVFFGPRRGTQRIIEKKPNSGFDSVIGNPPWGAETESATLHFLKGQYPAAGWNDSYAFFMQLAVNLCMSDKLSGMIVPSSCLTVGIYESVRAELFKMGRFTHVFYLYRVFDEVNLDTMMYIHKRTANDIAASVSIAPIDVSPSTRLGMLANGKGITTFETQNAEWECSWGHRISVTASPIESGTLQRVQGITMPLSYYALIGIGIQAYCCPKHSKDEIRQRIYHASHQKGASYMRCLAGNDVGRYEYHSEHAEFLSVGEWLYFAPPKEVFEEPRILAQQVIWKTLKTVLVTEPRLAHYNSIFHVWRPQANARLTFLLAILNCRLTAWLFPRLSNKVFGDKFPKLSHGDLSALPIRFIHFASSQGDRANNIKCAVDLYNYDALNKVLELVSDYLPKDTSGNFPSFQDAPNWKYDPESKTGKGICPEKSDIVHDFLAYLAEQMIDMNKAKQTEQRRFFTWLEEHLFILPDRTERAGIDALSGKTTIKNYLGDYQKGEDVTDFGEILKVLQKNKSRIRANLSDSSFIRKLEKEYEKSLSTLVPLKERLAKTDWLIDQIVYRLYGLTEEEIAIVEGTKP